MEINFQKSPNLVTLYISSCNEKVEKRGLTERNVFDPNASQGRNKRSNNIEWVKSEKLGPWWWSSGQRARLLLRRSEFESLCSFVVKFVFEKYRYKQKETGVGLCRKWKIDRKEKRKGTGQLFWQSSCFGRAVVLAEQFFRQSSSFGRAVASYNRGLQFESSHWQNLYWTFVYRKLDYKDENYRKEAGNGPFLKKERNWGRPTFWNQLRWLKLRVNKERATDIPKQKCEHRKERRTWKGGRKVVGRSELEGRGYNTLGTRCDSKHCTQIRAPALS